MSHRVRTLFLLPAALACLVLAACSENDRAKRLADNFLDEHLKAEQHSVVGYSKLDSTYHVGDSTAAALAASANASGRIKPFRYDKSKLTKKLIYMRVRYTTTGRDTVTQTFYFDDKVENIVTTKTN